VVIELRGVKLHGIGTEIQTSLNVNNGCPTATGCDVSAQFVSAPPRFHLPRLLAHYTSFSIYTDKALVWSGRWHPTVVCQDTDGRR